MEKLTIILNDPPYGTEKIYNGLRYASALVSAGVSVNLFLLADGNAQRPARPENADRLLQRRRHAQRADRQRGEGQDLRDRAPRPGDLANKT